MSWIGLAALRAERDQVVGVLSSLTAAEWEAPSACPGWTVHDVAAHMATTFHGVVTSYLVKAIRSRDIEGLNDDQVAARRAWDHARVLAEYEVWSRRLLRVLGTTQVAPLSRVPFPLAELGTYPLALLSDALAFDHHCHLRHDILAPGGPVERPVAPPDEASTRAVVNWILAGLPQMSRAGLAWLDRPVALRLDGPGGGAWTVRPAGLDGRVVVEPGTGAPAAATVSARAADVAVWASHRRPWREMDVAVDGDDALGARFLDSVRIV